MGPGELTPRKQNAFLIWELGRTMEAANFGLWGHVPLGSATGPGAEPRYGSRGNLHPPDAENFAINLQQNFRDFLQ